ncbi:MAG: hypothetical protein WB420_16835, partial [Bradyrhizobium sp.]
VGRVRMLAAGDEAGCGQTVGAFAFAGRKYIENATHGPKIFVDSFREGAIALARSLRQIKRNRIKLAKALHGNRRHCGQNRLMVHFEFPSTSSLA